MKACRYCDFENADDAVHCIECGKPLNIDTVVLDPKTRLSVDPLSFSPGETFGERYQIIEEIGEGGMGKVFKARDLELDIIVALKMIKPHLSSDPEVVARFKRELLITREIVHENVIRIYDLGEVAGIRYISMKYIQGNSLKETLQATGKLTIEKAIDVFRQICEALSAAHQKGIIHRDLKPQNIMIDKDGKANVLDFGIARSVNKIQDADTTGQGIVLGTPKFMSPEQIRGEAADASSDLYSLGVISYEMVTGELPFKGDSPLALMQQHLNEIPDPPSHVNPQVPEELERIILKCLEKKKNNRYASADDIIKELESENTLQLTPVPATTKRRTQKASNKKLSKYLLRFIIILAAVYIGLSAWSMVNDAIYKNKIEKYQVEYSTYYGTYFPIQKNWLPTAWMEKPGDCNSWNTYVELFPPKTDTDGNPLPETKYREIETVTHLLDHPLKSDFDKAARQMEYQDLEELKRIVTEYGGHFLTDRLNEAVKCKKLDGKTTLDNGQTINLALVRRYADMTVLSARVDFLEGNVEKGLDKLYHFMMFTLDLFSASTSADESQEALACFNKISREAAVMLICRGNRPPAVPLSVPQAYFPYSETPERILENRFSFDGPRLLEEEKIPYDVPMFEPLRKLLPTAINRFDSYSVFHKDYLSVINRFKFRYTMLGTTELEYHAWGKLEFHGSGFSINRYYYNEGVEFYRGLFEGMKYIRDMHNKTRFINEYFEKHLESDNIVTANICRSAMALNASRTLGKLILVVYTIKAHGVDSKQFLNLKSSDLFINELTGQPFEVLPIGDAGGPTIILDKNKKLVIDLDMYIYPDNHKQLLQMLKYFDSPDTGSNK